MALDSGIAKMGVFAFSFLVFFGLLVAYLPSGFSVSTKNYGTPQEQIPDSWAGMNILSYNFSETYNNTLLWGGYLYLFDIGGRNLKLEDTGMVNVGIRISHRYGFGLLFNEALDWYDVNGVLKSSVGPSGYAEIYATTLDSDFTEFGNLEYECVCLGQGSGSSYFKLTALLSFNTTLYSTPSDAFFNNDLQILFGIDPQNANVSLDIWNLITSLLTFNTIEVFGAATPEALALNIAIVSPFWAAIIIFAAAVLLEILPF